MGHDFLNDDDLADLLAQLEDTPEVEVEEDAEMQAAQRRYLEIIKKHKDD